MELLLHSNCNSFTASELYIANYLNSLYTKPNEIIFYGKLCVVQISKLSDIVKFS